MSITITTTIIVVDANLAKIHHGKKWKGGWGGPTNNIASPCQAGSANYSFPPLAEPLTRPLVNQPPSPKLNFVPGPSRGGYREYQMRGARAISGSLPRPSQLQLQDWTPLAIETVRARKPYHREKHGVEYRIIINLALRL